MCVRYALDSAKILRPPLCLLQYLISGKSNCDDKYVEKVFKWSEVHLSEMTCSKIHI